MPNEPEARQALPEELCVAALRHYEYVAMKACHWNNQIPQAIEFWYLGKPKLEAEIANLRNIVAKLVRPH